MSARGSITAALLACMYAVAHAAEPMVHIDNAWVRPANPGQPATPLYADIASNAPLTLVGARSDAAKGAALFVSELDGERATPKPVRALAVPADGKLRLAPRGAFVELRDITRALRPGDSVPFALEFSTADGKPLRVSGQAVVRGVVLRPTERADGTSDVTTLPGTGN